MVRRHESKGLFAQDAAGFSSLEAFGGYGGAPFDPSSSADLVIVARA